MALRIKNLLLTNAPLKIISLILGYTFWYLFSNYHISTIWIKVPICFYGIPENSIIHSPETISIKIAGKRSILYNLDLDNLAVHIDAQQLELGPNIISLTANKLFLPETIKLLNYSPSNLMVKLTNKPLSDIQGSQ